MVLNVVRLPKELNTPAFRRTWRTWVLYRSEIKRPLKSTTGVLLQLNRLKRYGAETASAMLVQSMENQWQGVFEVKRLMKPSETPKFHEQAIAKVTSLLEQELNLKAPQEECRTLLQGVKQFYKDAPGRESQGSASGGGLKYFFPSAFSLLVDYIGFVSSRQAKFKTPLRTIKPLLVGGSMWSWFVDLLEQRLSIALRGRNNEDQPS